MIRKLILSISILALFFTACSDDKNPLIPPEKQQFSFNSIITDSLRKYVEILSGEREVIIDQEKQLINSRVYNNEGNELAARYLENKLSQYGLNPVRQNFTHNKSWFDVSDGSNVYAVQQGRQSDKYYLIGAHYDSWSDSSLAPGADDNASGCGAVIEAARILKDADLEYSIIYAFWDEEEIGLVGSLHFAKLAEESGMNIKGIINLDMISWDSNDDGYISLFTGNVVGSDDLKKVFTDVVDDNDLELNIYNVDGYMSSDDRAFGQYGFKTIGIIEYLNRSGSASMPSDFNEYYHSFQDSVDKINFKFYKNVSSAAIATLYQLATHK